MHPKPLDLGGRALAAVIRPYPIKVAGEPRTVRFDPWKGVFMFEFFNATSTPTEETCTEIFVPHFHFGASLATYVGARRVCIGWERMRWLTVRPRRGLPAALVAAASSCLRLVGRFSVQVSDGHIMYRPQEQLVLYLHANGKGTTGVHTIRIARTSI